MQIILLGATLNCLPVGAADTGLPKNKEGDKKEKTIMSMRITSSSFPDNGVIPIRHTCEGHDTSPELIWTEVPEGAKSLVLIMDDPDAPDPAAPKRTWVHWVLYNIPVNTGGLTEAIAATDLPPGTLEGLNDWQRTGYGGPCPPVGNHRYFHKLYALDTMLRDLKQPTKAKLEKAIQGHVIAYSELIGRYQKRVNFE
jgi:Raf kinase inhibitor-like YbhB/YbcL family protein